MIDTILASLLLASICTTGALFLKWQDAKAEVARLKKENQDVVAQNTKLVESQAQKDDKLIELERKLEATKRTYTRIEQVKMPGEDDR